jgi:hypothetical protein
LLKNADVNAQGEEYGNSLQAVSAKGHDQIVQQLLEKGADAEEMLSLPVFLSLFFRFMHLSQTHAS